MAWVADTDNHRILNQECLILSQCRSLVTAVVMAVDSAEEEDSRERQMDGKVKLDMVTQEVRCRLFLVKLIKLR